MTGEGNGALQATHPLQGISARNSLEEHLLFLRHEKAYELAADLFSGKRILEIGCNNGLGTRVLAHKAAQIVAIDLNARALAGALKDNSAPNISYVLTDGRSLPPLEFEPEGIVFFQLIEHLDHPEEFLIEVASRLSENGPVVFTTPNAAIRLRKGQRPWNPYHVQEFRHQELARLLTPIFSQFEILGIRGTPKVEELERNRVHQSWFRANVVQPLTRIGRRLPGSSWVEHSLIPRLGKWLGPSPLTAEECDQYSTADFRLSAEGLDGALDFFVMARKNRPACP